MKLVRIHGPDDVRVDEVPEPEAGPRDAIVRVVRCGICGSDVGYAKLGGLVGPGPEPMPIGHELAGVVEFVGSEVEDLAVGTRVVLNPSGAGNMVGNGGSEGGFAPLLKVANAAAGQSLFPIPDSLSFEEAALAEPLGVGMNAVDRAGAAPGDQVVVFGAGPIGLAAIATLRNRGFAEVIAVDLSAARREIALELGAAHALDGSAKDLFREVAEIHGTSPVLGAPMAGSDVYIEASGAPAVIPQILARCKAEARISVVALHREPIPVNFMLVMMKQAVINGAMEYPERFDDMLTLLAQDDVTPMISHRFALEDFGAAFARAKDPASGGKVMIEIGDPA